MVARRRDGQRPCQGNSRHVTHPAQDREMYAALLRREKIGQAVMSGLKRDRSFLLRHLREQAVWDEEWDVMVFSLPIDSGPPSHLTSLTSDL